MNYTPKSTLSRSAQDFMARITRTNEAGALKNLRTEISNHQWLDRPEKTELTRAIDQKLSIAIQPQTTSRSTSIVRRRSFPCVY